MAYSVKTLRGEHQVIDCRIMLSRDRETLTLVVVEGDAVRMVSLTDPLVLTDSQAFLAGINPATVAGQCHSSLETKAVDEELFFNEVVSNLVRLNKRGVLVDSLFNDHLDEVEVYRESLDVQGLSDYLILENLQDVVDDSTLLRTTAQEVLFWQSIWRTVVTKAATLNKD